ncbi:type III pantothenate kinase [Campylobacter sp. FMV-PI01]|uniref:Type III pantothenate kinase n=1 Tax=Campylobacter portucalensis TaxID=2608384 RepID=A0A6L5WIS7_9BACT|nr:type III pantothenate kinase [Campylobacter portucalensis]MSN95621.1 type III pantothenate kinase [Campylobacter portucalensis]
MLLCDVGNFSAKFLEDGKFFSLNFDELKNYQPTQNAYYISVNSKFKPQNSKFIDISGFFEFKTKYIGLGIDRIAGCYGIDNGIVVDAGSAITVDIMEDEIHKGGYILPGIGAYLKAFRDISPALNFSFNFDIHLDSLPKNTQNAMSYGVITSIILNIKNLSKNKKIYFTGGNGEIFSRYFENSIFDKNLIFKGMKKALIQKGVL